MCFSLVSHFSLLSLASSPSLLILSPVVLKKKVGQAVKTAYFAFMTGKISFFPPSLGLPNAHYTCVKLSPSAMKLEK